MGTPEIGSVVVKGGIAGGYVIVLEADAMADAQQVYPDLPTYARPEIESLAPLRGMADAIRAVALVKSILRGPGDDARIIAADPNWRLFLQHA